MHHNFRLLAGLVLYAFIGSSWAAEQAVTRTITTDLGSNDTTMTVHSGTSSSHVLNVITNADGTRTIPEHNFGDNIGFSATGASLCKITLTSPYVNSVGRFIMVKSADNFTDPIGYTVLATLTQANTTGASNISTSANGNVTSHGVNSFPATIFRRNNGDFASIASNATGACKLTFETIKIREFGIFSTTNQQFFGSSIIPAAWTGTRIGILNFTMTVEGANETPVTQ